MELPEKRLSMRGSHQLEVHVLAMEQPLPGNLHDIILTRLSGCCLSGRGRDVSTGQG
ncbi:hypothetical protein [Streptomyces goshikiensis]|uniref:hypothetical protein n=1 Tax=Streptomyces goshikiensis TaxID=1942 RepID=UPI0037954BF7